MFSVYLLYITDLKFYAVALGSRTDTAPLCIAQDVFFCTRSLPPSAPIPFPNRVCVCVYVCLHKCTCVRLLVFLASEFFPIYLYRFHFIVFATHLFRSSTFSWVRAFCLLFSRTVLHHHEFAYHSFFLRILPLNQTVKVNDLFF